MGQDISSMWEGHGAGGVPAVSAQTPSPKARPPAPTEGSERVRRPRSGHDRDRWAAWTFVGLVVAAVPYLVVAGRDAWFSFDEWVILAGRDGASPADYFRPHAGHWIALPIVAFKAMWAVVGLHSYRPYQLMAILTHVAVAVLLRVLIRRLGVDGWIATVAAATFLLFGVGELNVFWAFQITLAGSMAFGLVQLILTDHEGPVDRRDVIGLVAGLAALMCSGLGVVMVGIVGVAVLVRRGWRAAACSTLPLAAIYLLWYLIERPSQENPLGRPGVGVVWSWIVHFSSGLFADLGHVPALGIALAVMLLAGLVVAAFTQPWSEVRRRLTIPVVMLLGAAAFTVTAASERWYLGLQASVEGRYLWIGAALVVPALAVAADTLARRWRALFPVVLVVMVLALPFNALDFRHPQQRVLRSRAYFLQQQATTLGAPSSPYATQVPPEVRPDPLFLIGDDLTIGWLLEAKEDGKLPDIGPLTQEQQDLLRLRLGLYQTRELDPVGTCTSHTEPIDLTPAKGDEFGLGSDVMVSLTDGPRILATLGLMRINGSRVRIELDDLHLRLTPSYGLKSYTWCA